MAFNENTRVKIPAILHLCRLGFNYYPLNHLINLHTQIRTENATYDDVQIKHFGEVLFTEGFIDSWINGLHLSLNSSTMKKVGKRKKTDHIGTESSPKSTN